MPSQRLLRHPTPQPGREEAPCPGQRHDAPDDALGQHPDRGVVHVGKLPGDLQMNE